MYAYTPLGSLQLRYEPTMVAEILGIPRIYFLNPLTEEREKKRKMSFIKKKNLTGLSESTCPVHGVLPIDRFVINKKKGKYYVDHTCIKCKIANRTNRKKEDPQKRNELAKKSSKRGVKLLANWYIDRLLIRDGANREDITDLMRAEKRMELIKKRGEIQSPTHKKDAKRKRANRSIDRLSDGYIRTVIKGRKGYNGEEITNEMIEQVRIAIQAEREKGTNKRYAKKSSD